jgi:hypothetical protein
MIMGVTARTAMINTECIGNPSNPQRLATTNPIQCLHAPHGRSQYPQPAIGNVAAEHPQRTMGQLVKLWLRVSFLPGSHFLPKSAISARIISAADGNPHETSEVEHHAVNRLDIQFGSMPQPHGCCANRNVDVGS